MGDEDLETARAQVRVFGPLCSQSHLPFHLHDVFFLEGCGFLVALFAEGRVENGLDHPAHISQVDEKQTSVIPDGIHPPHEEHLLSHVGRGQVSAV